jgi:hypothetical protein
VKGEAKHGAFIQDGNKRFKIDARINKADEGRKNGNK